MSSESSSSPPPGNGSTGRSNPQPSASVEAMSALWAESERRMYPLATTSPEKYQRLVLLGRGVADELGDVVSAAALVQRWDERDQVLNDALSATGLALGDLAPGDVAGVGFALRLGEVRAIELREAQMTRLRSARDAGDAWVVLHERGTVEHGLVNPYQSVEMHVESGIAIVASVESNPSTGQANHVLNVIRMDPETGDPIDIDPGIAEIEEYENGDEFTGARARLRSRIEGLT